MDWNLMKNVATIIIGAILVFVVIGKVVPKKATPVVEEPGIVVPAEMELTSTKGIKIFVSQPKPGTPLTSPLVVAGRAPGNWFFEANSGLILTDWDGKIIANGYVTAEGDWMTTDYVPFSGTLEFVKPGYGASGTLIFQKDNASGEPQFDDAAEMTITF